MTVLQGMSIVAGYSREGGNSPSCKSTLPVRRRGFIRPANPMSSLESFPKSKAAEAWNSIPLHVFMDRGFIQHQNNFVFNFTRQIPGGRTSTFQIQA